MWVGGGEGKWGEGEERGHAAREPTLLSAVHHRNLMSSDVPRGSSAECGTCLCVGWRRFGFGFTALHF